MTADFVPTDTANYNTLTGLSAGNFVINKATPTATLAVNNSPVTYDGTAQAATVGITAVRCRARWRTFSRAARRPRPMRGRMR